MEREMYKMREEMSRKDARILELSTMLPWKAEKEVENDEKLVLENEEGTFVIGDNEFVV